MRSGTLWDKRKPRLLKKIWKVRWGERGEKAGALRARHVRWHVSRQRNGGRTLRTYNEDEVVYLSWGLFKSAVEEVYSTWVNVKEKKMRFTLNNRWKVNVSENTTQGALIKQRRLQSDSEWCHAARSFTGQLKTRSLFTSVRDETEGWSDV